ncbi:hypothetical protein MELA_01932 [Candidatus Methylomirabilis lanthanidiphila]|uniref:Uncharacterized protein n=1 Tax=Candidatus Methylomirabilis lanthanidiphila TaxID=2211376 RepID=A0A564ZL04_9BACT|nr:hypothetical protein [Candidatus Methylomirabilis lanthanidiphila]VUZ85547.1 hypothetical protein MELA_01932 [Candidatus Methylomirabilis lanthanidiphila]
MTVFYLANVGTQDLTLNRKKPFPPRQQGEQWLKSYETVHDQLDAPILRPGLTRVIEKVGHISQVVLFVSDQSEATEARFRNNDTVFLGELLKRHLPKRFGAKLDTVTVERLHGNPANYDAMLNFFAERLPELVPQDGIEVVYVVPVGGTDASNVGLWVNAIRLYRRKVQLLYVMPDERVDVLALHVVLLRETFCAQAAAHLSAHDYAALGRLLQAEPDLAQSWAVSLSAYAHHRLHFDFTRAQAELTKAQQIAFGEKRAQIGRLQTSLTPFLQRTAAPTSESPDSEWTAWLDRQRQFLGELFIHLQVKADQEQWIEFLGRLFRLHEAILRFAFEQQTRHNTDGNDRRGYPDYAKALSADPALQTYLNDKCVKEARPTTYALGLAVEFWVTEHGRGPELGPVRAAAQQMEKLSELRNKSAIAHGYEGVSAAQIEQVVAIKDLLDAVRRGLTALKVTINDSPFIQVRNLLREALRGNSR